MTCLNRKNLEGNITLITYIFLLLIAIILTYLNVPNSLLQIILAIVFFTGATTKYFFSSFRATFREVKNFCRQHEWKDLILETGQFLAFPPGCVMPVPVPVVGNEPLRLLTAPDDLADLTLMPVLGLLGLILANQKNWNLSLIIVSAILLIIIKHRQTTKLIFKIFISLNKV